MAKVKHIQCDKLPQELEANAIYFVRSTGEVFQTDSDAIKLGFSGIIQELIHGTGGYLYNNYMCSNKDSGIAGVSFTGISVSNDIDAINNGYAKGISVYRNGARLRYMYGHIRQGVSINLPFIIGLRRYDDTGALIMSRVLFKQNVNIGSGSRWFIKLPMDFELLQKDEILLIIDGRDLGSNKSVRQFLNIISIW
jgi:hypothetical protein